MNKKLQNGFSLVEVLIVIVIIGILAGISVPAFLRVRITAENRAAVAFLVTVRSSQLTFYAQNGRYARLDELQNSQGGNWGSGWTATSGQRGNFNYTLVDPIPLTDDELKMKYEVVATRDTYVYAMNQSGRIEGFEP